LQRIQELLERAGVRAPRVAPVDRKRLESAGDTELAGRDRQRARTAFRAVELRHRRPACAAAGGRPVVPRQLAFAGDAPGRQNDSQRLASKVRKHLCIVLRPEDDTDDPLRYIRAHETSLDAARADAVRRSPSLRAVD